MKAMRIISGVTAMLAAAAMAELPEPVLVYRGKLVNKENGRQVAFGENATRKMRFAFYTMESGGTAFCTKYLPDVPIQSDGGFACRIDGDEVKAIGTNLTVYVGLTLVTDEHDATSAEIIPRRKILAVPKTAKSRKAGGLSGSPVVTQMRTEELSATYLTAHSMTVNGKLEITGANGEAGVAGLTVRSNETLRVSRANGNRVDVFDTSAICTLTVREGAVLANEELATAPAAGVAFVYCSKSGEVKIPHERIDGLSIIVEKGDKIRSPIAIQDDTVVVRFYPFLQR